MDLHQSRALDLRGRYESGDPSAAAEIRAEAAKYKFYHNVELVPGLHTAGLEWSDQYVRRVTEVLGRLPLQGKRVLDIGCRDGATMFFAEGMGAPEIIGIDNDLSEGLTEFLIPFKRSAAKAYQCNVYDLAADTFGLFDVVVFAGVLYHLRYPVWGLRRIADVLAPGGILLIEGGFIEAFADLPVVCCPIGTDSPFEPTSVTFFNEAGLTDTLLSIGFSEIRCECTFLHTFEPQTELQFVRDRFPRFFAEYGNRTSLSFCRKIFTCRKAWAKEDPRLGADGSDFTQEVVLRNYWDSTHSCHSTGNIKPDSSE
jgi:SAM-dependent methyltransferase